MTYLKDRTSRTPKFINLIVMLLKVYAFENLGNRNLFSRFRGSVSKVRTNPDILAIILTSF